MSKQRFRTIKVNGQDWKWLVGSATVVIRDPDNKKYTPAKHEVGKDVDDKEQYQVTPYDIRNYIKEKLL